MLMSDSYDMFNRRAVFIDRDGTVVKSVQREWQKTPTAPFDIDELDFAPRVKEGMRLLKKLGFLRIMVTNQPDVAYGHLTRKEWEKVHRKITKEIKFDDVFICRHPRGRAGPERPDE